MDKFSLSAFQNYLLRFSIDKLKSLEEEYHDDISKLDLTELTQISNYLQKKANMVMKWHRDNAFVDVNTFKYISNKKEEEYFYLDDEIENLNKLPHGIICEVAYELSEQERIDMLNYHGNKLNPKIVQTLIINLEKENQKEMLNKFKDKIISTEGDFVRSFIGVLPEDNQLYFLSLIPEYLDKLEDNEIIDLSVSIYDSNIEEYFKQYNKLVSKLDIESFLGFFTLLSETSIELLNIYFVDKFNEIPADLLMYKLMMVVDDPKKIYNFWQQRPDKLLELSDVYYNLLISRLPEEYRIKSLSDFKVRYEQLNVEELFDLFMFDNTNIQLQLFLEYQDKINEVDSKVFLDYVDEYIFGSENKQKIFLLYKNKINQFDDTYFLYFLDKVTGKNQYDDKKQEEYKQYIVANFLNRLRELKNESIPQLFDQSSTYLQLEYIKLLRSNIENLILEKKHISKLIKSGWGSGEKAILTNFDEQFQTLKVEDWYKLSSALNLDIYDNLKNLILNCEIDNLDFVDFDNSKNYYRDMQMFKCFEENLNFNLYQKYNSLSKDQLLAEYEEAMTKVVDESSPNMLTSYNCINLLILLRVLFKNKIINNQDDYYQMFKEMYMDQLLKRLIIENEDNIKVIKDSLFYRLVKGGIKPSNLIELETLKGLIFFNKNIIGNDNNNTDVYTEREIENFVEKITEEQSIKLNNKIFKNLTRQLMQQYKEDYPVKNSVRSLSIKLFLSLGYTNALKILSLKSHFTDLEYIFNDINIKDIKLDINGEPIINKTLLNFLFGSNLEDQNTNINRILSNTVPEFSKRFASIYNDWSTIYHELNGNITTKRILKYFEENKVLLRPDEYRLGLVIHEFGNDENKLAKIRGLYSEMKNRKYSTIPKIQGNINDEYSYEMLDLDDPLGLAVGYITRCCFLIDGESRTSLHHSATSKDGRIFIVRRNDELVAQSWVWRNGNLVCFDNVETRGHYDGMDVLNAYKEASKKILDISQFSETEKEKIKLVTVGGSYSKIKLPPEEVEKSLIQKPRVDSYIYTDASRNQYILDGISNDDLYYGDVSIKYQDERSDVNRYNYLGTLDKEDKSFIIKRIRSINYAKTSEYTQLDFNDYCYCAINEDWYLLIKNNGDIECALLDHDKRAKTEIFKEIDILEKSIEEISNNISPKSLKTKVLQYVSGGDK